MTAQTIAIATPEGDEFSAYLALPESGSGAGIVVIQEIFGVNDVMRQTADAYAQAGYVAIVPDLFWRQEPGIQLTDKTEADWQRAFQLYQGFDEDAGTQDLITTLNRLRQHPACTGKVGSLGFCLGGKLAYLMATRSDADCNVSYYGVAIDQNLSEAQAIQHPLLMHIAEEDQFVPKDAQQRIQSSLSASPFVTLYHYPGVNHAFARVGGQHYDAPSADLANSRTADFLQAHLSH